LLLWEQLRTFFCTYSIIGNVIHNIEKELVHRVKGAIAVLVSIRGREFTKIVQGLQSTSSIISLLSASRSFTNALSTSLGGVEREAGEASNWWGLVCDYDGDSYQ
jgi:hypothetical protein